MGGSGGGMIAASIIDLFPDMKLWGFLNDSFPIGSRFGKFKSFPVIGTSKDVNKFIEMKDVYIVIAYKTMKKEKEMWEKYLQLNIPQEKMINLIHPTTIIPDGYCSLGNGLIMAAGVQLSPDTTISDNCILFGKAFVGHDSFLDKYITVANNASIGAEVHVGKACHIGSNATIKEKVKIGDFSIIGMGALVLNDVPENSIVAGVPAKVIRHK
jgi:acetyltransferase EpsM